MDKKCCLLFDIDGTLTTPRNAITSEMRELLQELRKKYTIGIVGGSNEAKIAEQLGQGFVHDFDYAFLENGLVAYHKGTLIASGSIQEYLGDEKLNFLAKATLHALADADIPKRRGTFFELRRGLINISPIGRDCTQEERDEFEVYDKKHGLRQNIIDRLVDVCGEDYDLKFSIGGQISFDVFPRGWDKTYCLRFLPEDIATVHFFGDKTAPGGNDFEIFNHARTIGHRVTSFADTMRILRSEFLH